MREFDAAISIGAERLEAAGWSTVATKLRKRFAKPSSAWRARIG